MRGRRSISFGALSVISALAALAMAPAAQADTNLGTVAGLTYIRDVSQPEPSDFALTAKAACPAGTHVIGGGARPFDSELNVPYEFWLNRTAAYDGPDPDGTPDDGWIGRGFNWQGGSKRLVVSAICFAGEVRYATKSVSGLPRKGMTTQVPCPAGTHVAGGGASLSGNAERARLHTSYPYDSGDADQQRDDGWLARAYNSGGGTKTLTVQAMCVGFEPRYVASTATGNVEAVSPSCPAGTHATGGGGKTSDSRAQGWLNGLLPFAAAAGPPDDGFTAVVSRHNPSATLTGTAICKT